MDIEPGIVEKTPEEIAADKAKWDKFYWEAVTNTSELRQTMMDLEESVRMTAFEASDLPTRADGLALVDAKRAFEKVEEKLHEASQQLVAAIYWLDQTSKLTKAPCATMTGLHTPVVSAMSVRPAFRIGSGDPQWLVSECPFEDSSDPEWHFVIDEEKKQNGVLDVTAYVKHRGAIEHEPIHVYENATVSLDAPELTWTPEQFAKAIYEKGSPMVAKLITDHDEYYRKLTKELPEEFGYDEDEEQAHAQPGI